MDWLEKNVEVTHPAEEFIRVSMKTDQRADGAAIINAIVNAYLQEAADLETGQRRSRSVQLEKAREDLVLKRKVKQARLQRLAEEVGATSDVALSQAELAMVQFYEMVRDDLARDEFSRSREEFELKYLKSAAADDRRTGTDEHHEAGRTTAADEAAVRQLEASINERGARIAHWRMVLDGQMVSRKTTQVVSLELDSLRREMESDQRIVELINEAIARAELEGDHGPRVSLFRKAETTPVD